MCGTTKHDRFATVLHRSEEHTSELQSQSNLVCRLLLEKTNVAPPGSCGHPESVTYGPRKRSDGDTPAGIVIKLYPKIPIAGAALQLLDSTGTQIAHQQP